MKSTGNRIQDRREELGWTREQLAQKLGTNRLRVWRLETGKTPVKTNDLPRLARTLKTTIAELVA